MTSWWRDAVIYQVYPRSFADSDGDGIGDVPGIAAHLGHLRDLGVDGLWLSPVYPSPMADAGYDVSDYRGVEPIFGTLADLDSLIEAAHGIGLKVLMDLVPNHTSDEHAWFRAALAAGPGSPERRRYLFRDGRGADGGTPPNNWRSVFSGSAWTRVTEADGRPGQWYLHLFDTKQPDLNWENAEVRDEFHAIVRFWMDRGVDGLRIDVAHGLMKAEGLPDDAQHDLTDAATPGHATSQTPMWDQEGVHDIYRGWRTVLDEYDFPERVLCAEAWVEPVDRLMRYLRPDELHQAFSFAFLEAPWRAPDLRETVLRILAEVATVGAPATWVLSNHDVVRHASRLGLAIGSAMPHGISADDPQPDPVLGLRRARAATTLMLALPGAAYLYQGEELGLPEHTTMPSSVRQDPVFRRTGGSEIGRDGCRCPMPWVGDAPALGFSPTGKGWLPQPASYAALAVDQQVARAGSTLELYRTLLRLRRDHALGRATLSVMAGYAEDSVVAFRLDAVASSVAVIVNLGPAPVAVPAGSMVLVASGDLALGLLPTDTAAWVLLDVQG